MIEAAETMEVPGRLTYVRIGELRTASTGLLKATLGSCVAIAMIHERERICGLAHCFLPVAPEDRISDSARYADRAVFNLLRKIAPNPASRLGLRAYLSGGGRLLCQHQGSRLQVGQMNVEAARESLNRHNIPFSELESGGEASRSALVDCDNFTFTCDKIENMLLSDTESSWKQL